MMSSHDLCMLGTAALDTADEVAFWLRMLLETRTYSLFSLKIWQVSHFVVLSYELLLTTCNALTLALHSVNKQKNNERYN